jgi:DNA-binding MarR family transcriptional regulator
MNMADPTSPLSPDQLQTYLAFTEASALLRLAVEKHLQEAGNLSYIQFQLLTRLSNHHDGRQRMTDLADGVVSSRSGLTYQAQLLERRGLIERSQSPDDERSTTVALTSAGRDALDAALPGHIEIVRGHLFAPITHDDAAHLARILGHVTEQLRAAPPRSAGPRTRH